jgi:hypothetical protein
MAQRGQRARRRREATVEDDLGSGAIKYITPAEWSPEVVAAYELAHLGFYTARPVETHTHAKRLAEEFGVMGGVAVELSASLS